MSKLPRFEPGPFGSPGSLGSLFAAGDPAAVDLFPSPDRAAKEHGSGRSASALPPSCGSPALAAEVLGTSSPAAEAKARSILDGGGFFVTTGQQPCLFLGPLYVLYKALTAIRLAETLERKLDRPVLALFWVASDDHDWREVGTTHLIDTTNELRSVRLRPPPGRERLSVGRTELDGSIRDLLEEVREALPVSEFIGVYLELFGENYRPGRSVGRAFGGTLAEVLAGRELVWLDSAAPEVKQALRPLLSRALSHADSAEAAVLHATSRARNAGFEAQLAVPDGASNVFVEDRVARRRVYVEGDLAWPKDGSGRPLSEMLGELERTPEAFSPSAALRPVAESCLLPVIASVLGPAEVAYWAQLPGLFGWAGIRMPRPVPRTAWAVIEGKIAKVLESIGVAPEELSDGGAGVVRRYVREERPETLARALEAADVAREQAFDRILEAIAVDLPGIRATAEKARAGARKAAAQLARAVDASVLEQGAVLRGKIDKAVLHLYPAGSPQERVLNPLYYLARYGPEFVEALDREVGNAVEEYVVGLGEFA